MQGGGSIALRSMKVESKIGSTLWRHRRCLQDMHEQAHFVVHLLVVLSNFCLQAPQSRLQE